jgi:phosphatidyl-myo-inositol alpha-mannosyltransferase
MPLRIGIISQAYHPAVGGVTEHVDATVRVLRGRGHDVTVITSRFTRDGRDEAGVLRIGRNVVIPYNGAENNMTVGMGLPRRLAAIFERSRFDVVHTHCPLSPVLPLLTLRLARCPVVGTFHSSVSSDIPFWIFHRPLLPLYRRIDQVLAVSETARRCVERYFPGPLEIVPNGVDHGRFRPGLPRLERYDDGVPNILFVGRFDPRKGLPDLMRACAELAGEGLPFRLILVGDGQLRGQVERLAGGALEGRVHFEGRVGHERLPRYYASADIFCSPARDGESFGLVLLEAMASGVPIVATDLAGYRTVLTPGKEGLMAPPRDPATLAAGLRRLLTDPALRGSMGLRGIETARMFGWERIVDRLEAIYHTLAARAGTAVQPRPGPLPTVAPLEAALR